MCFSSKSSIFVSGSEQIFISELLSKINGLKFPRLVYERRFGKAIWIIA